MGTYACYVYVSAAWRLMLLWDGFWGMLSQSSSGCVIISTRLNGMTHLVSLKQTVAEAFYPLLRCQPAVTLFGKNRDTGQNESLQDLHPVMSDS